MSSDAGDYFVDRCATKMERFNRLLDRARQSNNPMTEEFAEAWLDILDIIMEQQVRTSQFVNRILEYYAKNSQPPAE